MTIQTVALVSIAAAVVGVLLGIVVERRGLHRIRGRLEAEARSIREAAERDAESVRKTAELAGREEAQKLREEWAGEAERRRGDLEKLEQRAAERTETLDGKLEALDQRQERVDERREAVERDRQKLEQTERDLRTRADGLNERLEKLSGLSRDEARRELINQIQDEAKADAAQHLREVRERSRREAEREAKKIISQAIEKLAVDHSSEAAVSVVALPSDDMKGRIIGREGRNIRSFEAATGVDVVVDDTPEAVILSCFDPVRREVARLAMERLVVDGRIHPGRIEEVVEKAQGEVQKSMMEAAEEVLYELGIHD
ncbi:MAG: Rnase Y domain-containing protein, partial [Gemmatimonadota bacterium]